MTVRIDAGGSDERIVVTYRIAGRAVAEIAEAIRVEQTIEFPIDLAPDWIQTELVGHIESMASDSVVISYDPRVTGGDLVQLLNVLWGNVSLLPGVRIIDLVLPGSVLATLPGPRFGVDGLRTHFDAATRPLLCTALKPMGLSSAELAHDARILASAGFDLIKDDHSLANQEWAPWSERVRVVSQTVREVSERTGVRSVYVPTLNVPADRILDAAHEAKAAGAGGLLVLPGLTGFDVVRVLAEDDDLALPIISHPSFLGSHVMNPDHGFSHGLLLGTLTRLSGADICIFPNHGGRFSFSPAECLDIRDRCAQDLPGIREAWPSPGGGMTLDRISEIIDFYGSDVTLLIGGALHRNGLERNARAVVDAVRSR